MQMIKCPRCFTPLNDKVYVYACLNPGCSSQHEDELIPQMFGVDFEGTIGEFRQISKPTAPPPGQEGKTWQPPSELECPVCEGPQTEVCEFCHYPLPRGYHQGESICIAFAGARATGKSLYIAVAISYLKMFFIEQYQDRMLNPVGKTEAVYKQYYEDPLFMQRGMLAPTPEGHLYDSPQRDPLIYQLTGQGLPNGKRWFLVFRDVAGEDWARTQGDSARRHRDHLMRLDYLKQADTILFLFDPLALPQVRAQLHGLADGANAGGDPEVVLNNLVSIIGDKPIPLGLLISKFDTLQQLAHLEHEHWAAIWNDFGSGFVGDNSLHTREYQDSEGQFFNEEIRSLLNLLGATHFLTQLAARGLRNYRFFGVSALGRSPHGMTLNPHGISPFRVLAPIKWALANRGLIGKV